MRPIRLALLVMVVWLLVAAVFADEVSPATDTNKEVLSTPAAWQPAEVTKKRSGLEVVGDMFGAIWQMIEPTDYGTAYLRDMNGNDTQVGLLSREIVHVDKWGSAFLDGFLEDEIAVTGGGVSVSADVLSPLALGVGVNRHVFVYYASAHWAF